MEGVTGGVTSYVISRLLPDKTRFMKRMRKIAVFSKILFFENYLKNI